MNDCIFCKILKGEIPSSRVYEDDDTLAFLDIAPVILGHTLVIPKRHVDPLTAASPQILTACLQTVQLVIRAQQTILHADGANLHQANGAAAGQVVPHLHFHVIPRFVNDGHHWNWKPQGYENSAAMQSMAEMLANVIKGYATQ